ncbi:L-histidine N(alpha)-methyltransferase [Roseibium sp. CAU 1637]|uniref:L-histidine N(Alpha)-methyltransferase n=1 Tax=Roseibium limicola TaxID=2816037 RepID=A0A939ENY7_9HYPH|nr:L-histidine N(alpha)-methyltransferase [Roseibium limicola]MBO0345392.1 L-histidine N(alpha)-methyltransferase [Roseibium limicola]
MSVAHTMSLIDIIETPERPITLQQKVQKTIASHTEFSLNRIVTQDNRVKYARPDGEDTPHDHLNEVFQLMRQLNEVGVSSHSLGRTRAGGMSFRKALEQACAQIAADLNGRALVYVELGPEPVKTGFVLKTLAQLGVSIDRYIAVDINPKSAAPMRANLEKIIPGTPMQFVTAAFETIRLETLLEPEAPPALITMLGFQEGNDDPFTVNGWLRDIARQGDLLLSESQLYRRNEVSKIPAFYGHAAMQRFSRIAFEQAIDRTAPTLNRFFLLPVTFQDGESAQVAILGEEFTHSTYGRSLHVSNFCLKLTADQYRHYRQHGSYFEIIGESFTDDETLHFQLSRRT